MKSSNRPEIDVGRRPSVGRGWRAALALLTAAWVLSPTAQAAPVCTTLFAGQTVNAGTLCVDNDTQILTVTYATTGGWTMDEVHLFVGTALSEMPQTKTGNPKVGHFPYTDSAPGATSYTFRLPLGDFGATCGSTLVMAAHAALSKANADGTVRTESAWGAGTRMVAKGNWATYSSYKVQCPPPPPFACRKMETGYAFGDQTFADIGLINDKRWGWQLSVHHGDNGTTPIYAGAAQNDLTKGTHVGTLYYSYANGALDVTYSMFGDYSLKATHLYAGDSNITTSAPGKYGNQHSPLPDGTTSDGYSLAVNDKNGDGVVFIVAHAEVCFR